MSDIWNRIVNLLLNFDCKVILWPNIFYKLCWSSTNSEIEFFTANKTYTRIIKIFFKYIIEFLIIFWIVDGVWWNNYIKFINIRKFFFRKWKEISALFKIYHFLFENLSMKFPQSPEINAKFSLRFVKLCSSIISSIYL